MLLLAFVLCFVACDSDGSDPNAFDPDAIDYDQVTSLDYGDQVQPLLAARNVFAPVATTEPGDPADYAWSDVFESAWGETIVPFDAPGSLFVRFVRNLANDVEISYPNLRNLQDDEVRYLARWIEAGARNDEGEVPYADAEHLLYAAVQGANTVAIIDAARRQIIRNIYFDDLGLPSAPNGPHYMVFEADRSAVYVSLVNANRVVKISGSLTLDPSDPAYLLGTTGEFTTPGMMALDPDTGRLYVGRSTASQPGTTPTLGVFDSADLSAAPEEFPIPNPGSSFPHALALTPDGRYLLTAPLVGDYALVMDAATGDYVSQVPVDGTAELVHFSILAGGETATLTANPSDGSPAKVLFFTLGEGGSLVLDDAVATRGERAWHAHLDSDGVTVMVPNRASHSVSRIHVPTGTVQVIGGEDAPAEWPLRMPHSPGPTHAGAFFVSSSNLDGSWAPPYPFRDDDGALLPDDAFGNVVALDPETGAVLKTLLLGHYPSGLEHWHGGGHGHGGMNHGGEMDHEGMEHQDHGEEGEMDHDGHQGHEGHDG